MSDIIQNMSDIFQEYLKTYFRALENYIETCPKNADKYSTCNIRQRCRGVIYRASNINIG